MSKQDKIIVIAVIVLGIAVGIILSQYIDVTYFEDGSFVIGNEWLKIVGCNPFGICN